MSGQYRPPTFERLKELIREFESSGDRGVTAVLAALSMVVLLGMGAVALDVGNTYQVRRTAQNAADQIAVAAAFTECSGGTAADVQAAADRAATANGFDYAADVTLTQVAGGEYEATVQTQVDTTFGTLLGVDQLATGGTSVVSCESGGGSGTTLHAHAGPSCGGNELRLSGDDITVNGGSHSNGDFGTSGDTVTLVDGATYGGNWNDSADETEVQPDPPGALYQSGIRPWPNEWSITDYAPTGEIATAAGTYYHFHDPAPTGPGGTLTLKEVDAGIHYVDGNLILSAEDTEFIVNEDPDDPFYPVGVTFVATGTISVIADEVDIKHYNVEAPGGSLNNALLMFSNHDEMVGSCSDVVAISSAGEEGISYEGVIFAPHGTADITTNGAQAVAIWANFVDLDGDSVELSFPEDLAGGPPKVVFQR